MYVQELDIIDPSPDSSPATVLSPTPPPGLLSWVESGIDDSPVGDELFAFGPPSTHRPKKWNRRVLAPVKGNNRTGRAGKLRCLECRKVKAKCVFESEAEPCDFCVERNRHCEKVFGPLRTMEIQRTEVARCQSHSLITYPLSLITDSNLSVDDLRYLRIIFAYYAIEDPNRPSVHGKTFRFLWETYGFNFLHSRTPILIYSALAFGALNEHSHLKAVAISTKYYQYMSQFLAELRKAIRENAIEETHLFAVCLAVWNGSYVIRQCPKEADDSYYLFVGVLCAVLDQLLVDKLSSARSGYPGQHLWRYLLSYIRRSYQHPRLYDPNRQDPYDKYHALHLLDMKLLGDNGTHQTIVARPNEQISFDIGGSRFSHYWDVTDITASLRAVFNHAYCPGANTFVAGSELSSLIKAIRSRTGGFQKFKYLDRDFERVWCRRKEETLRDEVGVYRFMCAYVHLSLLLCFLEAAVLCQIPQLSSEGVSQILSYSKRSTTHSDSVPTSFAYLFCLAVICGPHTTYAVKALSSLKRSRHRCAYTYDNGARFICSCHISLGITKLVRAIWESPPDADFYIRLLLGSNWIWHPGHELDDFYTAPLSNFMDCGMQCEETSAQFVQLEFEMLSLTV